MLASASALSTTGKLVTHAEEPLELTEHDLWEDDTGAHEVLQASRSSSAPSLSLDTSSDSDSDIEPPSPDIKAFHGDLSHTQQLQQDNQEANSHSPSAAPQHSVHSTAQVPWAHHSRDNTSRSAAAQHSTGNTSPPAATRHSTDSTGQGPLVRDSTDSTGQGPLARDSTDGSRQSFESASAMPISTSGAHHRARRPPLRANSTFIDRDGLGRPRPAVKMGSSAPINIPLMSRLHFKDIDDDDNKKPAPFVPPHLFTASNDPVMQQQHSIFTGESLGSAVRRQKLQQRNAILRRTGFLEGPARVKGVAEVMDTIKESHFEKDGMQSSSALTAALGSSPSVGGV